MFMRTVSGSEDKMAGRNTNMDLFNLTIDWGEIYKCELQYHISERPEEKVNPQRYINIVL